MANIEPYTDKMYEARSFIINSNINDLSKDIIRGYVAEFEAIVRDLNNQNFSEDNKGVLFQRLAIALGSWQAFTSDLTKRYSIKTIDSVGKIHSSVVKQVSNAFNVEIGINLNGFRSDAFEAMYTRRGLDIVNTFKTLGNSNRALVVRGVERALLNGVANGTSWRVLQKELANNLALGYPDLQRLLSIVDSPGFDLRQLKVGASDELKRLINKILSDARRIAVTEIDSAYHEGERIASIRNPIIKAIKWNLSGRHEGLWSSPDICDVYAQADSNGLGEGVFYPETLPPKPHPNCACSREYVTRSASEWNTPKDTATPPSVLSGNDIKSILESNKNKFSRTITPKFIESTSQIARQGMTARASEIAA